MMQRTTKKERKENARNFYQLFKNYKENRACIVVNRNSSGRTQFLVVPGCLNTGDPVVVAEDASLGVEGCWMEFIRSILGGIHQKTYFEDGFKEWLSETLGFAITYYDGMVFIIERQIKNS